MIKTGDTVMVDYIGRFPDGEVFDTSIKSIAEENWKIVDARRYEPLMFVVWSWMMIKGFDEWVVWMEEWETKTLELDPENAYWNYDSELIKTLPIDMFKEAGIEPKIDEIFTFNTNLQWRVIEVNENEVKIDFNSPMAWKTLVFDITVVKNLWNQNQTQ